MGEAYFVAGDLASAPFYDKIIKRANPNFPQGMKAWEQNKKNHYY